MAAINGGIFSDVLDGSPYDDIIQGFGGGYDPWPWWE